MAIQPVVFARCCIHSSTLLYPTSHCRFGLQAIFFAILHSRNRLSRKPVCDITEVKDFKVPTLLCEGTIPYSVVKLGRVESRLTESINQNIQNLDKQIAKTPHATATENTTGLVALAHVMSYLTKRRARETISLDRGRNSPKLLTNRAR